MSIIGTVGIDAGKALVDKLLKDGGKSSEYLIALAGLALIAGGGAAVAVGYPVPLSAFVAVTIIVVSYIASAWWRKSEIADVARKATGPVALAMLVASCAGTIAEDPRYQLAKACEAYARAMEPAIVAVDAGRVSPAGLDAIEVILDEVSPLCEQQTVANPASAIGAAERAVIRLQEIVARSR